MLWTESFEEGVGLLDETTGGGDTAFIWNATDQTIDASFVRSGTVTQRYAGLGGSWDAHAVKMSLSVVVTPQSFGSCSGGSDQDCFGFIGFLNSSSGNEGNLIGLRLFNAGGSARRIRLYIRYGDGTIGGDNDVLTFNPGTSYLLHAFLDGPNHLFTVVGYTLIDGQIVQPGTTTVNQLDPQIPLEFDAVGLANGPGDNGSHIEVQLSELAWNLTPIPTESFASGVGCLSQTIGDGNAAFAWNAAAESIDATFVRNGGVDQRLTDFDDELDVHSTKLFFSAIVTPQSFSGCGGGADADCFGFVGLLNSSSGNTSNLLGMRFFNGGGSARRIRMFGRYADGSEATEADLLTFNPGVTYLVQGFLDGHNRAYSLTGYGWNGTTFGIVTTVTAVLNPDQQLEFNSIGLSNGPGNSGSIMQVQLSELTCHPLPDCPDLNGDGEVGAFDLAILLGAWGPCPDPANCPADLQGTGDGIVGPGDLAVLLGNWGPCP